MCEKSSFCNPLTYIQISCLAELAGDVSGGALPQRRADRAAAEAGRQLPQLSQPLLTLLTTSPVAAKLTFSYILRNYHHLGYKPVFVEPPLLLCCSDLCFSSLCFAILL